MTESHIITCDKCCIIRLMIKSPYIGFTSPSDWEIIEGQQLCPKCYKKFKLMFGKFMKE